MQDLFALEDLRWLRIGEIDGEICLRLDKFRGMTSIGMMNIFTEWHNEAKKLKNGEITKEEYDYWRYNYPRIETERFKEEIDARRAEKDEGRE